MGTALLVLVVLIAYLVYALAKKIRIRDMLDGLSVAAAPGIFVVRIANFINAELVGRPWDGPWAMKFPKYAVGQNCAGCALYQGKAGDKAGGCPLFAGKQVAGAGWCSAWAKKA